ncbi:hypothetical protein CBR_g54890 [Chara braunii]|uniref:Uncharacterized protein n=1 Tax=Chara braunii TaxID=69332 RepID=A0A388JPP1_CHABU|nr:hypothetical protein CBR_g54890 [Chara braunii]|eukprot:GBG59786.1 hypothetical protein CBR_g54890 [Chara braunii]
MGIQNDRTQVPNDNYLEDEWVKEMVRACYEDGILPTNIDGGTMKVNGREVAFVLNRSIDELKVKWLKSRTVTVIFRDGARFLPRRVKENVIHAYEDGWIRDDAFGADFKRGRIKVESPNVASYIPRAQEVTDWMLAKKTNFIDLVGTTYRTDFKPWMTRAEVRDWRKTIDESWRLGFLWMRWSSCGITCGGADLTRRILFFSRIPETMSPCPRVIASAPGKVLVTGAYLILERPNAGLVLSTSARFFAVSEFLNDAAYQQIGEVLAGGRGGGKEEESTGVVVLSPQLDMEFRYSLNLHTYQLMMMTTTMNSNYSCSAGNPYVEYAIQYAVAVAKLLRRQEDQANLLCQADRDEVHEASDDVHDEKSGMPSRKSRSVDELK